MKTRFLYTFILLLFAAAGCTKDAGIDDAGGRTALNVVASHGDAATNEQLNAGGEAHSSFGSEAATRASETSWSSGDAIGIFMLPTAGGDALASNRRYTTTGGGAFSPGAADQTVYFPMEASQKVDFAAYYPYNAAQTGTTRTVSVADQSDQSALDHMTATKVTGRDKTNPDVAFEFVHRLSRLSLVISAGNGRTAADLAGMTIGITGQYTTGTLDLTTGAVIGTDDKGAVTLLTTAEGLSAAATLLPSVAEAGRKLQITLEDGTELSGDVPDTKAFAAGQHTTYNIKVHAGTVEFTGVTVSDWDDADGGTYGTWPAITTPDDMKEFLADFRAAFGTDGSGGTDEQKAEAVAKWTGNTGIVRLGAAIDMTGITTTASLGDFEGEYKVVFDGGGYTLTGLTRPLFYHVNKGSEVRDLVLTEVDINNGGSVAHRNYGTIRGVTADGSVKGTDMSVGGIVGVNEEGTVVDCEFSGEVDGEQYIGGIVGENSEGTVIGCKTGADSKVSGSGYYVGGIVGINYVGTVAACSVGAGAEVDGKNQVGGIAGYNSGTVAACSVGAGAEVDGKDLVGGIAGQNNAGTLAGCWSAAAKVGGTDSAVGGIAGRNTPAAAAADFCFWLNGDGADGGQPDKAVGEDFGSTTGCESFATAAAVHTMTYAARMNAAVAALVASGKIAAADARYWDFDEDGLLAPTPVNPGYYANLSGEALRLVLWAEAYNAGTLADADKNFTLREDVDLRGYAWTPVAKEWNKRFTYTFDGGGHTIRGLRVDETTSCAGLFGNVFTGGKIISVHVEGTVSGTGSVGGIAGSNQLGTIGGPNAADKCTFTGTVSGSSDYIGGIVGSNQNGPVSGCTFSGTVNGTGLYTGGIVGYNGSGSITGCTTGANAVVDGTRYVGGIVGHNTGGASITDCDTGAGAVVSGTSEVGGIAGQNDNGGSVTGCTTGDGAEVSGTNNYIGGITGYNNDTASITGCDTGAGAKVSGASQVGGIAGANYGGTVTGCTTGAKAVVSGTADNSNRIGGIVGYNDDGTVTGCTTGAKAEVSAPGASADNVGGIVGRNESGDNPATVTGCRTGDGSSVTSGGTSTGGIVGLNKQGTAAAAVTACHTGTGMTVTGWGDNTGGIAGSNNGGTIGGPNADDKCTFTGTVTGADVYTGGIAGANTNGGAITGCTASGKVAGDAVSGGIAGQNEGAVTLCKFTGTVGGPGYLGGIAGGNEGGAITGCTAAGTVGGAGAGKMIGGIAGSNNGAIGGANAADKCTFTGTVAGTEFVGGITGSTFDGTVTNCRLGDGSTVGGTGYVGGIVGAKTRGSVTGCEVGADATIKGTDNHVGGIVGSNQSGPITNCRVEANADISGTGSVGGIVGNNFSGTVTKCRVEADATIHSTGNQVGGIVGSNDGTVTNCRVEAGAAIRSTGNQVGGIAGSNDSGIVSVCYSLAALVTGGGEVGGIAGYNDNNVNSCYWLDTTYNTGGDQPDKAIGNPLGDSGCRSSVTAGDPENPGGSPLNSVVRMWWVAAGQP